MTKKLPSYVYGPIDTYLVHLEESEKLLHLSMHGISVMRSMPKLVEAVIKLHMEAGEGNAGERLDRAKAEAELAEKECSAGFPLLHAHTLVGVWGSFEAAIEDTLVNILCNEPEILKSDAFAKIKVPLAEFEVLEKTERMRFLVTELGRSLGRKQGFDAFEGLLNRFNLSGPLKQELRTDICEMHHVRNVIVHRRSYADRRLVESCPWLGLKVGDPISVNHRTLGRYITSLTKYTIAILYRLRRRYGMSVDPAEEADLYDSADSNKELL